MSNMLAARMGLIDCIFMVSGVGGLPAFANEILLLKKLPFDPSRLLFRRFTDFKCFPWISCDSKDFMLF